MYLLKYTKMNFKINKIILFCNSRITPQIYKSWNDSEYIINLLNSVKAQAKNKVLSEIDFDSIINYILYTFGNYYRGNIIFTFQILVAFLYLLTPVDVVSDFLPFIGYIDDLMLINLILKTYSEELIAFNKVNRDQLDIEYLRIDENVINQFGIDPDEAINLIINDQKLDVINGEKILNSEINNLKVSDIDEYINLDVNSIIQYELINYLSKSKTGVESINDDLIEGLIQIPNIVTKKDINYFIKNINELLPNMNIEFVKEKKGLFGFNQIGLKFNKEEIYNKYYLNFVQVDSANTSNIQIINYESTLKEKFDYEHIVEIIDISNKKFLFENTILYFKIVLNNEYIEFKLNKLTKEVSFHTTPLVGTELEAQLEILAIIIKERLK